MRLIAMTINILKEYRPDPLNEGKDNCKIKFSVYYKSAEKQYEYSIQPVKVSITEMNGKEFQMDEVDPHIGVRAKISILNMSRRSKKSDAAAIKMANNLYLDLLCASNEKRKPKDDRKN